MGISRVSFRPSVTERHPNPASNSSPSRLSNLVNRHFMDFFRHFWSTYYTSWFLQYKNESHTKHLTLQNLEKQKESTCPHEYVRKDKTHMFLSGPLLGVFGVGTGSWDDEWRLSSQNMSGKSPRFPETQVVCLEEPGRMASRKHMWSADKQGQETGFNYQL